MSVYYRPARLPDDEALLIDLNEEYLRFVFEGVAARFGVPLADIFPGGDIRAYLPAVLPKTLGPGPPESCFHILEQQGQPIGMGGVRRVRDGVCEMKRVYVRDAAKGQGLGRALAERLIADARGFGYRTMFLDTSPTLATAIGLYERLGFARISAYPEVEVPEIMFPHWVFMARDL
ncbi:GNAT family N-acetyltransferase [Sandarakinorhabdus sp. AAP62]|uniref:GNAT family N-acetyltransferase n=1 Tax=Sandarakinorhabdus sp. AAP62 TaxID=1248916 RepID=UPI0002FF635F|nr:GNAT family N-acetyltransferase [Sandarakinorhabdus sp. AAP62]